MAFDSIMTVPKVTPVSRPDVSALGASSRSQLVLLQSLVSIVLSYQILFSPEGLLARGVQEILVLGLLLLVAGAMVLPVRLVEARAFTIVLLLVDTTVTSAVIYISGNAGSDLYLAYFLIILISASASTLKQKIGFSMLIAAAYGVILYLGTWQSGMLSEGHLIRISILLVMGVFYGMINETLQEERDKKAVLIDYIAALKRAEEAQRESEERFRRVFHEAPMGVAIVSVDNRLLEVSRNLCDMLGYTERELMALTCEDIVHPEDREEQVRLSKRLFNGEIPSYQAETRYMNKTNRILWVRLYATAIRDQDGKALYGLAMIENVTERKQMEQHLLQIDKLAALGTLLGGVAHELNNPLFMISGLTQVATERVNQGLYQDLPKDLASIRAATHRASTIVERFLGLARSSSGHRQRCDVNTLLQNTLELIANDCLIHKITVRTDFMPELAPVFADPQVLSQVFLNLVTNARQAVASAHGQGTLTVTTDLLDDCENHRVEVRVADDGPGISPEDLPRIFEPFFTTKPIGSGTGLGLSIAHRIVTELGGALTCESAVGAGSTFIVLLPALLEEGMEVEVLKGGEYGNHSHRG